MLVPPEHRALRHDGIPRVDTGRSVFLPRDARTRQARLARPMHLAAAVKARPQIHIPRVLRIVATPYRRAGLVPGQRTGRMLVRPGPYRIAEMHHVARLPPGGGPIYLHRPEYLYGCFRRAPPIAPIFQRVSARIREQYREPDEERDSETEQEESGNAIPRWEMPEPGISALPGRHCHRHGSEGRQPSPLSSGLPEYLTHGSPLRIRALI